MNKVAILLFLVLSCCGKKETSSLKPQKITTCLSGEPGSFDPRVGVDSYSENVLRMLFSGLVFFDKDGDLSLALANEYDLSPDRITYTFYLKKNRWSDGSALTAQDFIDSWKKVLDPKFNAPNINLFYYIKNARAIRQGLLPADAAGIRALDDYTLQIELEQPHATFLEVLTNTTFFPVHRSMRDHPIDWDHFVSCGPFKLKKYSFQNEIVLTKNEFYFDAKSTKLDELDFFIIKDERTAHLLYEKGIVDWLGSLHGGISMAIQPYLQKQPGWNQVPIAGANYLLFNHRVFPLNNSNIRKALSLVIDRASIVENILQNSGQPAESLIPKIQKKERWHPYFADADIAKAQELFQIGLKEEGLTLSTFPTLKLASNATELWEAVMLAVQAQWKKYLHIDVSLEFSDFAAHAQKLLKKDYHIARFGWRVQYNDPGNLLDIFRHDESPYNRCGWKNDRFDALVKEAFLATCEEERWQSLEEAEAIFFEEMPICPLFHGEVCSIHKPYVKDVVVSPLTTTDFRWASIENYDLR